MGMFGWIKSKVFGNGVSAPAALTKDEVRDKARNGTQLEVELMLSQHPQWANSVLNIAIGNDRLPLIYIAKKYGGVIDNPSALEMAMWQGHLDTAIALLENGAPLPTNMENAIADAYRRSGNFRRLFKALLDRLDVKSIDYLRLVEEWRCERGLRDVSALLHEFGYDFSNAKCINIDVFQERVILGFYEGELCDLLSWGQKIDFDGWLFKNPLPQHEICRWWLLKDAAEAEQLIAERTAANIAQALADAGLAQDDTPKPKRRM